MAGATLLREVIIDAGRDAEQEDGRPILAMRIGLGRAPAWGYGGVCAVKQSLSKDNRVLLVDDGDAIQGILLA